MLPEGWAELIALLDGRPDSDPLARLRRLCGLCAEVTGVSGAAVSVTSDGARGTVCATDDVSDRLEDLQVTFSEGPCVEALREGWPVLVPDLAAESAERWPWFSEAAVRAGACAVFALPLRVGAIRLGVLDLYRTTPGGLTTEQLADARTLTEAAAILLTLEQPGEETAETFLWLLGDRSRFNAEVHQAVGVTMVELGMDARDAFARICAYAYAESTSIAVVAAQIVARRLRLEPG